MGILGRHATHFDFRLMGDQILLYNMPICKMVLSLHSPIPMPPLKHPFNPHWMLLSWQAVSNPPLPSCFLMFSLNHPCKSHRMHLSLQVVNSLFLLVIDSYLPGTETCSQSLRCQQLSPSQPPHPHPSFHVLFCMYGILSRLGQLRNYLRNVRRLVSDGTWLQRLGEEHCALVKSLSRISERGDNFGGKTSTSRSDEVE